MSIVLKSLAEALAEIESCTCFLDESISPLNTPEKFDKIKDSMGNEIYLPTVDYRVQLYSWFIKRVMKKKDNCREFTIDSAINEMFTNAFLHGNSSRQEKSINVKLDVGFQGSVISIRDEGKGFDFKRVLEKFESGEKYFTYQGNGFKSFKESKHIVSFDEGGRITFLQYLVQ